MKKIIKTLYKIRFFYILINHAYNFYLTSKLTNPYIRKHKLKRLSSELDFFINKILNNENFALARNADGERAIMLGISVESQEKKWTSPNYISKLGESIYHSLDIVDSNFYYAISCPCCDREAYYWYTSRIKTQNTTFANLWINHNFRHFKSKFELIKRDAVLIANYRARDAKIGNLNILKHYAIDDVSVANVGNVNKVMTVHDAFIETDTVKYYYNSRQMFQKDMIKWNDIRCGLYKAEET